MLNPVLSNTIVEFGNNFFPEELTKKYDMFLYQMNYPLKNLRAYIHETIQNVSIPGLQLSTIDVQGLNNHQQSGNAGVRFREKPLIQHSDDMGNRLHYPENYPQSTTSRTYPGSASYTSVVDSVNMTITFKNSILNWLYIFEWLYKYYRRNRTTHEFDLDINMLDSAEVPMLRFHIEDSFVSQLPPLEFAYNGSFSETKTFDMTMVFNRFNVEATIPGFNNEIIELT